MTYASLKLALRTIIAVHYPSLHLHIFSLLLSLALADFSAPIETFFTDLPQSADSGDEHEADNKNPFDDIDKYVKEVVEVITKFKRRNGGTLKHAGAVRVLWDLAESVGNKEETVSDLRTRYALYKLLEGLFTTNHRNGGVISSLGIVGDVFRRLQSVRETLASEAPTTAESDFAMQSSVVSIASTSGAESRNGLAEDRETGLLADEQVIGQDDEGWETVAERPKGKERDHDAPRPRERAREKQALQKLLRRLLEMGSARTTEARDLFQSAVVSSASSETEETELDAQHPDSLPQGAIGRQQQQKDKAKGPPTAKVEPRNAESLDLEILDVIRFGKIGRAHV